MGTQPYKDHFSQTAAAYAAQRPTYPPELAAYIAGSAPARNLAWEAGCGSGQMSLLLARHFARVLATDASAEQLAHASEDSRITYVRARAEAAPVRERAADAAVVAQAAHWFDLPAYFAEVKRAVRPGAVVALIGYGHMKIDGAVDVVVWEFYDGVLGAFWPPERRMIEDAYRTIPFPFREIEPPAFEMQATWSLAQVLGYIGTWSAVWRLEKTRGPEEFARFRGKLAEAWGDAEQARRIVWPLALRIGRVD